MQAYKRMRVWNYRSGAPDRWNIRLIRISVSFNFRFAVDAVLQYREKQSHQKYIERIALSRWYLTRFTKLMIKGKWENRMKRQTTGGRTKRLFCSRNRKESGGNNEDRKDGFCKGWKRLGGMNGALMARISMREKIHRVSRESCQLMNIYEHSGFIYKSKSWKIISNFW